MHKALWFFSGLVVAVALAAAWMFLIAPRGHHREARMDEPVTRAAMLEKQRERFGSFDANADGTVTLAEWEAFHAGRFDTVDSNKDGTISEDEMRAAKKANKKPGDDE
jgi:hypothetical protein